MPLIQGKNLVPRVSLLCPPRQKLDSREDGHVKNQGRLLFEWLLNPLHLNTSRHILHTFFYTFFYDTDYENLFNNQELL